MERGAMKVIRGQGKDTRRKLLALIHMGKKAMGLDEAAYRRMLRHLTGKNSCKDMDIRELNHVLNYMVVVGGFKPGEKYKNFEATMAERLKGDAREILGENWEKRLRGLCRRLTGIEAVEWLHHQQLRQVWGALRRIEQQEKKNGRRPRR